MTNWRRQILTGLGGGLLGAIMAPSLRRALALEASPRQTRGPFYPETLPLEADADLAEFNGGRAQGTILHLFGRVLNADGAAVEGARVLIWQCDANGLYHHPRDREDGRDPHFQGSGVTTSDHDGRVRFRTIRPVPYSSRTPHVHIEVSAPGYPVLATQLYRSGHRLNARDFIFRRLSPAGQRALSFREERAEDIEPGSYKAGFDIVIV